MCLWCAIVCIYMYALWECMCVCRCVCLRAVQRLMFGVLDYSLPYILLQDFSLNLNFNVSANLSSQLAPDISCLCFLHWDYGWATNQPTLLLLDLGIWIPNSHTCVTGTDKDNAELSLQIHWLVLLSTWYDLESTSGYVWEGIYRDLSISATSIFPDTSLQFPHSPHAESKPEVLQESSGLQHQSGIAKAFSFVDWVATGWPLLDYTDPIMLAILINFFFIIHNIYMHFIGYVLLGNIA